jgi:hypothetical protein
MAIAKALFSTNKNDDWETPAYFYNYLDGLFQFELDPCASQQIERQKRIDTKVKFTQDEDGLSKSWDNYSTFVNPPYSQIKKWTKKAMQEFDTRFNTNVRLRDLKPIVVLVPSRTDTKWFWDLVNHPYAKLIFLKGRLRFGKSKNPAPFPSCVIFLGHSSYMDNICLMNRYKDHTMNVVPTWILDLNDKQQS